MGEERTCAVCGCTLSDGGEVCPVCGAVVVPYGAKREGATEESPRRRTGENRERKPKNRKRKRAARFDEISVLGFTVSRTAVIAAGVVLALVVVVIVALIVRGLYLDSQLKRQVEEAASGEVSASSSSASLDSGYPGNAAAGGIVAKAGDGVLVADSEEVLFVRDSALEGTSERKVSAAAWCLCSDGTSLYYLKPSYAWGVPFRGSAIERVSNIDEGGQIAPQTLHDTSQYRCLSLRDGKLFYIEEGGIGFTIVQESLEEGSEPQKLGSFEADEAWLFADGEDLYVVQSASGNWSVSVRADESAGESDDANWVEVAKGTGELRTASISKGMLYYSLKQDGSHLQRSDLKGGFNEYPDIKDALNVASTKDAVAVVTKTGQLLWIDPSTGVVHDLSGELQKLMPDASPSRLALSVGGTWIYLADDSGNLIRVGMKGASGEELS